MLRLFSGKNSISKKAAEKIEERLMTSDAFALLPKDNKTKGKKKKVKRLDSKVSRKKNRR